MKHNEQNITFELNEKLSFESGQEIEEMISISIDPDIVIQAYKEHVQIRGIILLTGEYHRGDKNIEQTNSKFTHNSNRYVEKVVNLDDHLASFSHRFPVDIAVAKDRVEKIENVVVMVDSFDYELPSANILNVTASLHIQGILAEKSQEAAEFIKEKPKTKKTENEVEQLGDEAKNKEIQLDKYMSSEQKTPDQDGLLRLIKSESRGDNREMKTEDNSVTSEVHESATPSVNEKLNKEKAKDKTSRSDSALDKEKSQAEGNESENTLKTEEINESETETRQVVEKKRAKEGIEEQEMQIELSESAVDDETEIKDVTFLTELFEEEEETYTQVTIYIAQEDDSIESIAKRYEIPVLQLLKDNNLSADTIEAGQLITIRQRTMS